MHENRKLAGCVWSSNVGMVSEGIPCSSEEQQPPWYTRWYFCWNEKSSSVCRGDGWKNGKKKHVVIGNAIERFKKTLRRRPENQKKNNGFQKAE